MRVEEVVSARFAKAGAPPQHTAPTVRVQPSTGWSSLGLRELWEHRELVYFFVWRDLKVRYKQTVLGAAWAILQPLHDADLSLFFGRLAKVPSDGVPYPLFAYAALVPWTFFANGLTQVGRTASSGSANLFTKVYFPRLADSDRSRLLGARGLHAGVLCPAAAMVGYYGIMPTADVIWLPLFVLLA